ncbi:MAG: hypothetical protein HQM08_21630 [Candidatus Riflebacteria bacterium]|nr:hypothetical protein [Candidatus Riflebacteria bacterium]
MAETVFKSYSRYYTLSSCDKNYSLKAYNIKSLLAKHFPQAGSVLEFWGKEAIHVHFLKILDQIEGLDFSKNGLEFRVMP